MWVEWERAHTGAGDGSETEAGHDPGLGRGPPASTTLTSLCWAFRSRVGLHTNVRLRGVRALSVVLLRRRACALRAAASFPCEIISIPASSPARGDRRGGSRVRARQTMFRSKQFFLGLCVAMLPVAGAQAQQVEEAGRGKAAPIATQRKSAASGQAEEVVVTAIRDDLRVHKTVASVTSLSPKALDRANIVNISGLNGSAPGLNVSQASGYQTNIAIRGIGMQTPENTLTTSSGVAFYVDGVYVANSVSLDQTLFDLERLDVLRGPQGTLYATSAPGGAIVLQTAQPQFDRLSGRVEASGGNYNLSRGRVELNVPLSSTLAIRGSFQKYDHDGFAHTASSYLGRYQLDDAHDISGKIAIKWQPVENFSATLTGQWYGATPNGPEQKNINDPIRNPRVVSQDYPTQYALHTTFYHLNLDWRLPWATFSSVTATQHVNNRFQYDSGRLNFANLGLYDYVPNNNNALNNYSQTFSLHAESDPHLSWDVGITAMGQRGHSIVTEFQGTTPLDPPLIDVPEDVVANPPADLSYGNRQVANRFLITPYFQVGYRLTRRLHVLGGVRYNYDRYSASTVNFSAFGTTRTTHSFATSLPTWKAEIDYDLSLQKMLYFSIASGYKPGGVNGNPAALVVAQTFKPEQNLNFEIGSKNWFFDHTLMFNGSAFFSDYTNMQYIANDPYPYAYGIANIPRTHIYGLEAEAAYLMLHDRLRIEGNFSLENGQVAGHYRALDASALAGVYATNPACAYGGSYYNPACWAAAKAASTDTHNNKPPGLVSVQGALSASYTWDVPYGKLLTRVQYIYRGPYSARVYDNPHLDHVPSYNLLNFYMNYGLAKTHMDLSLACTNLTNKAGVSSQFTDPYGSSQTSLQYIAPRQIVGTVSYSF